MHKTILFCFFISFLTGIFSQYSNVSTLKLEEIMKGKDFIGHWPSNVVYLPNDNILFQWRTEQSKTDEFYTVNAQNTKPNLLTGDKASTYPIYGYEWNAERTVAVYVRNGDIYIWQSTASEPELWYDEVEAVSEIVSFTKNEIHFIKGKALHHLNKSTGKLRVLAVIGNKQEKENTKSYLESQEFNLIAYNRILEKQKQYREEYYAKEDRIIDAPEEVITKHSYAEDAKIWSFVAYDRPSNNWTEIHDFLNKNGEAKPVKARPKVGKEMSNQKIAFYDFKTDSTYYFTSEDLPELHEAPAYYKYYNKTDYKNEGVVMHQAVFNESERKALFECKAQNNKHRWLVIYDVGTHTFKIVEHQHDEKWIGGPGISYWNEQPGNIGWLDDKTIYFQSETTGYSHLYKLNIRTKKTDTITDGKFEIRKAELSKDKIKFYVHANKTSPRNTGYYEIDASSGKWTTVLEKQGGYQVHRSRDEKYLAYLYSTANQPWELYLQSKKGKAPTQVTQSVTKAYSSYAWQLPEQITFKSKDGKDIYARLYKPNTPSDKAVIFVHGAGYLQNAHNWWSVYYREYMFHHFLMDNGYTVLDIDYRASDGYGRDWRTGNYREMGGKDLEDNMQGRKYLIEELGIPDDKIGIYGGSYGGFITLMALLKEPGKFQCGAALRSVTDWAHYNHEYTSNFLNTPEQDSLAFQQSSPIYYAENLEDELLMLHGVMDDNVQFQDVVRLTQRFIELGKTNFELAIFPVEPHSFKQTSSWVNEYSRIYRLFEENLTK